MLLFAVLPLIARSIPYILGGLDYLRRQLLPSAPNTLPVDNPYVPPFTGGQCPVLYFLKDQDGRTLPILGAGFVAILAPITSITYIGAAPNNNYRFEVKRGNGLSTKYAQSGFEYPFPTISLVREDGSNVECGNVPNPNPSPSISDDGIATSPSPNPNNFIPLITGIAAATAAAFLAAKAAAAAALAAAKAAAIGGNIADAIAKLADALAEILKLLAALEKKKEKEKDEEKTVSEYDFGRVEKDGFLRLYPDENLAKQELSYLDVQVENVPAYTGKYFGQLSPHYYRYKSLGYISFVSPTFGILETRQIDFRRLSLNPPENAFGFFYHFGLDGILKANLTGFYTKKEEEAEPPAT